MHINQEMVQLLYTIKTVKWSQMYSLLNSEIGNSAH